ncbi:unnamed protein product [Arctogadus glacialis]
MQVQRLASSPFTDHVKVTFHASLCVSAAEEMVMRQSSMEQDCRQVAHYRLKLANHCLNPAKQRVNLTLNLAQQGLNLAKQRVNLTLNLAKQGLNLAK